MNYQRWFLVGGMLEEWLNRADSSSVAGFAVTPAVLEWFRARRPDGYVFLRNTLVGTSVAALIMYWLLPLAPPRLSVWAGWSVSLALGAGGRRDEHKWPDLVAVQPTGLR